MQHSPHYDAAAAELSHDDLLTHGYLGRVLMREPNAEAFRRSYEEVCRTVLTFLDASLKGDAEASRSLNQHIATSPVSIHYQPAR